MHRIVFTQKTKFPKQKKGQTFLMCEKHSIAPVHLVVPSRPLVFTTCDKVELPRSCYSDQLSAVACGTVENTSHFAGYTPQQTYLLHLKDTLVKEMLQLLVCQIDAELFKAIVLKILETKNVQHACNKHDKKKGRVRNI